MTTVQHILLLFSAYAPHVGLSESRVSTLIFNRGGRVVDLRKGGDLTTRMAATAVQWFSDNWPDDLAWPADVPRPVPAAGAEQSAAPSPQPSPRGGEGVCAEAAE